VVKKNNFGVWGRIVKIGVSITLLSTLIACGSNYPFNPIVKNKVYKPKSSIAVVSGGEQDGHVKLVGFITDRLTKQSSFQVMSQKEIEKRIPGYPATILINTEVKDGEEKPVWFPASEKAKLNAIQAKLKVDYIFVVWNRSVQRITVYSRTGGTTTDYVYPAGNLIAYPGGKVVASTMSVASSDLSPLALFRDADYYILDALEDASDDIVDEFVDVTDSKK
jgi:hypothetical protein